MLNNGQHFPDNSDKFVFDEEVTRVFCNMALRSIPMYAEVHRVHAEMLFANASFSLDRPLMVYDVGASRGGFLYEICRQCSLSPLTGAPYLRFVAIDSSPAMLEALSESLPWVQTVCSDVLELPDFAEQADVISMFYLLQFIHGSENQLSVLRWVHRNLKPGGLFISGHKGKVSCSFAEKFDTLYYAFRRRNGYTPEEIDAKTAALRNSMWPCDSGWLENQCYRAGFTDYTETTRWLQFYTSICTRGD